MGIQFNIKDGARPEKRLCDSCRNSVIMKGGGQGQEVVYCHAVVPGAVVPFKVVECSRYQDKNEMTKREIEMIGWVIEVKNGKVMGFKQPKEKD
jgi:hypothetical protein